MSTVDTWKGAPELRAFLRPIEELQPHPENPRRGDVALVRESLNQFGQLKPIITDRDNVDVIVAGNHTWHAARSLGWTHVAAIEMWSEAFEGERYLLMDNRTSDNSSYDREELLALLNQYEGDQLERTGFTPEERELLRMELEEERRQLAEFQAGHDGAGEPARPQEDTIVRNLLIAIDDQATFEQFGTHLKVLQREWGIVGNSECIAEAVRRELLRIREEGT